MTLKAEMIQYRAGMAPLPQGYIALHEAAARRDMNRFLAGRNCQLVDARLVDQGWCDGMRVLELIALNPNRTARVFVWNDANGGAWFERCQSGGSALVECPPNPVTL